MDLLIWRAFLIAVLLGFIGGGYLCLKFMRGVFRKVTR